MLGVVVVPAPYCAPSVGSTPCCARSGTTTTCRENGGGGMCVYVCVADDA
jgi:hypothetical protein